ncbi:MAG: 3-oxoacyl-ACP reductase FabG [Bacillota bacterium]
MSQHIPQHRTAIVTGAGSRRGIGRAICTELASMGYHVVAADLDLPGCQEVAEECSRLGPEAMAVRCDVTSPDNVEAMVLATLERFGRIDVLVNNAGITQRAVVTEIELADWERILKVNLTGAFLCTRAVLPYMKAQGYGRIVSISSVSAKQGGGVYGGAHYCAAKAGILGFTKAVAREMGPYGITANAVCPGLVATDIRGGLEPQEVQQQLTRHLPIPRMAQPFEVAAAVAFLASDRAAYITGEALDINGGLYFD